MLYCLFDLVALEDVASAAEAARAEGRGGTSCESFTL